MPKVSVIVPVYNVEKYLRRCIDSILAQTFTDFELLLVDDGSPDNCGAICDEYAYHDSRIRVIHQENQGQAVARNHAVIQATGEWVCFVDSDDIIHPQMLEFLFDAVTKTGAKISMCNAIEHEFVPIDFWITQVEYFTEHIVDEAYLAHLYTDVKYRLWTVWAKLINREIVLKYPFTPGRIYEDNAIVCKWLYEAGKITDTDNCLYFYSINPLGTTKHPFSIKKLDSLWAKKEQAIFFRSIHYEDLYRIACSNYMMSCAFMYDKLRKMKRQKKGQVRIQICLLDFWIMNRNYCCLSDEQYKLFLSLLHPHIMNTYWMIVALHNHCKKAGLKKKLYKVVRKILGK